MKFEEGLLKLKEHFKSRGPFYALMRGFKYLIFLVRDHRNKRKQAWRWGRERQKRKEALAGQRMPGGPRISNGKLELVFSGTGIDIFYEQKAITTLAGLNIGIHSLGLWTNSTQADWHLLEKTGDLFRFRVQFKELCVRQVWTLKVRSEKEIAWEVVTGFDGQIYINEIRYVSVIPPRYKSWFCDYRERDFSRTDDRWHTLCLEDRNAFIVGVRFPVQEHRPLSLALENIKGDMLPVVQSLPATSNACIIGFRNADEKLFTETSEHHFSVNIHLFDTNGAIDEKMELLRQKEVKNTLDPGRKRKGGSLGVVLANLPWQQGEKWGVRAGSRWPHITDESEGNYLPFPFFLATAAALLKKNNIRASLIDAIAEKIPEDLFIRTALDNNEEYWVIETSVPSFFNDLKIIRRLSQAGRYIVLCGPNTEIYKPEFLEMTEDVDFVLYGEYEQTLLELIQAIQGGGELHGIQGLIFRDRGKVIKNSPRAPCDINQLPWPDRTAPFMDKYWDLPGDIPHPSVQMLASRGCSFGCHFCLWPQVMYQGNHYRARDIGDVVDEMEYLVKQRKFKSVYFDDDTFNIGKERMLDFCRALKKRGLQDVPWAIMARADLMDEEILREMKSAGLWAVKYGVESQEKRFLKNSGKKLDLDKATKIIEMTTALGIQVHLTFCFGFTGETEKSIQKTIEYAIAMDPDSVQFSILTPFPGTALFDELDREGRILTKEWDRYDGHQRCVFKPDLLTPEELVRAKNRAYALWGEHKRKKAGLGGDMKRFGVHLKNKGLSYSMKRAYSCLQSRWNNKKLIDGKS